MCEQTVIQVKLTTGRYHAHPWGVSQYGIGEPEWPPSPWRLLRALAAAWFNSESRSSSTEERDELLNILGRCGRPTIIVPKTAFHELQYFQPVRKDGKVNRRADHRDCFATLEGGSFWFVFPCALDESKRQLLKRLIEHIRYFGRSESRSELILCDKQPDIVDQKPRLFQAKPTREAAPENKRLIVREVLCSGVLNSSESIEFQPHYLWSLSDKEADFGQEHLPEHLTDACLNAKRPLPRGCEWVDYILPAEAVVPELPRCRKTQVQGQTVRVTEVWFKLSRRVPIPVSETVRLARAFRNAAVANLERFASGAHSATLTGKSAEDVPMQGNSHCYYLPRPGRRRKRWIEKLVVYVPGGKLSHEELDALMSVSRIWERDQYPVTVVAEKQLCNSSIPLSGKKWRSLIPLVTPLNCQRKSSAISPEDLAALVFAHAGLITPFKLLEKVRCSSVVVHNYSGRDKETRVHFSRRLAYWLEVEFDETVQFACPAIGKDAHFGLGQFEPSEHD